MSTATSQGYLVGGPASPSWIYGESSTLSGSQPAVYPSGQLAVRGGPPGCLPRARLGSRRASRLFKFGQCNRKCHLFLLYVPSEPCDRLSQIVFAGNVVPVEYRASLVPADLHGHDFWNAGSNQIADFCAAKIVEGSSLKPHPFRCRFHVCLMSSTGSPLK